MPPRRALERPLGWHNHTGIGWRMGGKESGEQLEGPCSDLADTMVTGIKELAMGVMKSGQICDIRGELRLLSQSLVGHRAWRNRMTVDTW